MAPAGSEIAFLVGAAQNVGFTVEIRVGTLEAELWPKAWQREVLPRETRLRALSLWETARSRAAEEHQVTLDVVQEPLLALIAGRIPLVTDDQSLKKAQKGTAMLIDLMMRAAKDRGWSQPAEFFLNFALANRRHLFPFTD